MPISPLFICATITQARHYRFDAAGNDLLLPIYLATASLVPLAAQPEKVPYGGTWWSQGGYAPDVFLAHCTMLREKGYSACIMSDAEYAVFSAAGPLLRAGLDVVVMPDPVGVIAFLAQVWRIQSAVPIVAIAGSVGKTLIISMLETLFSRDGMSAFTHTTPAYSLVDIQLGILQINEKNALALFEMPVCSAEEMQECMQHLQPTIALVTNVCCAWQQASHNSTLLATTKQQVFSAFSPSQIGIICGDCPPLARRTYGHPVVRYGLKKNNMVTATQVVHAYDAQQLPVTRMLLCIQDQAHEIVLPTHHKGVLYAALGAAAVAYFLYMPTEVIARGFAHCQLKRTTLFHGALQGGRGFFVADVHGISPESVKASLQALHAAPQMRRKIAVIGEMPALGVHDSIWHRLVGCELAHAKSIHDVVLVGEKTKIITTVAPHTMNVWPVQSWQEAQETVLSLLAADGNVVLMSGAEPEALNALIKAIA